MASPNTEPDERNECFKYKGVRKRKWGKWVSEIRLPNSRERIWLGSYDSAQKAARAFDAALFCLRGDRANFNFPDTPFQFHLPPELHHQSLSPHQIQLLAATFANQPRQLDPDPTRQEFHSHTVTLTETASASSTSSSSPSSCVQSDHGDAASSIDWSFLKPLDSDDLVASDYGLFSEFGEFNQLYDLTTPPVAFDHNTQEYQTDDALSHHSFLWNFGYEPL